MAALRFWGKGPGTASASASGMSEHRKGGWLKRGWLKEGWLRDALSGLRQRIKAVRPGAGNPQTNGKGSKNRLRRAPLRLVIAYLGFLICLLAIPLWLWVMRDDTIARLEKARSGLISTPVTLPDGSMRFPDETSVAAVDDRPLDPVDAPVTLAPSRNDALLERLRSGLTPRIAADGMTPWRYYARPFPQDDPRPRIAIIITGLGGSKRAFDEATARLPGAVTFAFSPSEGVSMQILVDEARAKGHESLLAIPLEPDAYPVNDPGANTLLRALPDEENVRRLEARLSKFTGYVGILPQNDSGGLYLASTSHARAILLQAQRRGLIYVDLWQNADTKAPAIAKELAVPRAMSDLQIDRSPSPVGIEAQLRELERLALANGVAVGFIEAHHPVSIAKVADWSASLRDRGIVLAPVTAIVNRQADRAS
jgi:uncharacterized protein